MDISQHIAELFLKYHQQELTDAENLELHQWASASDENRIIFDHYTDDEKTLEDLRWAFNTQARVLSEFKQQWHHESTAQVIPLKRDRFRWKYAAAAAIVILISTGTYFLLFQKSNRQSAISKVEDDSKRFKNDVAAPDISRAQIKLDDGTIVYLDSAKSGSVAMQGNVNVEKLPDGQIKYTVQSTLRQAQGDNSREVKYNTISNPKGSNIISLTLADGSQVWLNADATLTYPTVFTNNERKVEITGEAYFEVAHDAAKPFIVSGGFLPSGGSGWAVKVLGTHFNINAYDDEEAVKTTLLEGSVLVSKGNAISKLTPGQQSSIDKAGNLKILNNVNTEAAVAWKNGLFQFSNASIEQIMRQVEKWYNVEVQFDEKITAEFGGDIPRKVSAISLFKILETTGEVRFKIEGKKVTVMKVK